MKNKLMQKSYTFQVDDETSLTIAESPDRYSVGISVSDCAGFASVNLNAEQFKALAALNGYGGIEVYDKPEPEPTEPNTETEKS